MKLSHARALWLWKELEGVPGVGSMSFKAFCRRSFGGIISGRQMTLWRKGITYRTLSVVLPGAVAPITPTMAAPTQPEAPSNVPAQS